MADGTSHSEPKRARRAKADAEIILLCNPRAGGRWRELAEILDSPEALHVRRIVTDSVEDVAPALEALGQESKLLCIYGGDGTIQRILDQLWLNKREEELQLALIGGGTMNVTASWCGLTDSPARNFRSVVQAYFSGQLLIKEVPLLKVQQGSEIHYGFTFGIGPVIRVLDAYERGAKGKAAALSLAAKTVAAVWLKRPKSMQPILHQMDAEIYVDGERLPYDRYVAVFGNVTGQINPGVEPFVETRSRDTFYMAAYSVDARDFSLALPFLIRGWLPVDTPSLLRPATMLRSFVDGYRERRPLPTDPRYVNSTAASITIHTKEPIYTLDGEILPTNGEPLTVELGPVLKLVVSPTVALGRTLRFAARATGNG